MSVNKKETMYKLLSFLLNLMPLFHSFDWQNFYSLTFSLMSFIYFPNIDITNISIHFEFTALCQFSCACYHEIVYVFHLKKILFKLVSVNTLSLEISRF